MFFVRVILGGEFRDRLDCSKEYNIAARALSFTTVGKLNPGIAVELAMCDMAPDCSQYSIRLALRC